MEHLGAPLQSRGYSVVAYDTRGHGDSDWNPAGRYDVERLATDLLAVRDHFSADTPPAVVGASLGGMTALGAHLLASGASWAAVILVDSGWWTGSAMGRPPRKPRCARSNAVTRASSERVEVLIQLCHRVLVGTRGVAMTLARVDFAASTAHLGRRR